MLQGEKRNRYPQELEELRRRVLELEEREKELAKKLRAHETLGAKILNALPINIFLEDSEGRTVFANEQACKRNGMKYEEIIGKTVYDFFPREFAEKIREHDLEVWRTKEFITKEQEVCFQGEHAHMFTGKMIIQAGEESGEDYLLGFALDITDRVKAEEKVEYMAYHDALTGLPNRRFMHVKAERHLSESRHENKFLAVFMLDLDYFKVINDSLGHQAGDLLLQGVARRLRETVRAKDIAARLSGDEFVIMLPHLCCPQEAWTMANKIMKAMAEPFYIAGQKLNITTTIGISVFPNDGTDIDTLIKNADIAMYQRKEQGRNGYQLFDPAMKEAAKKRMDMEILLRKALENNEFVLYYQPKMNLNTGRIYGMEALIRWRSKEKGMVPPSSFIGIAEETGLIVPIGEWVIREACRQCKAWHDAGLGPLSVSVNLSALQFERQDLEELVTSILKETGLPPHALELELTESIIMKNPQEAAITLGNLKKLGVSIAIDDFGTGFSSLSYLKNFPIDTLKIDRSFTWNLDSDNANAAIALAVISLAHSLNLSVVAEGVENEGQLKSLYSMNCEAVQGYHIGKPLDKETALLYLKQAQPFSI
ncbi:MAG: putative bifunctional diguanylate cyclase/phosphodiesterase [Ectobacillus sp.]